MDIGTVAVTLGAVLLGAALSEGRSILDERRLKRRRVGRSGTSGSGILSIGQGCTPTRGSAALIAISGTSVPALVVA